MLNISLDDIKLILGIEGTEYDETLDQIRKSVLAKLERSVGDLSFGEKKMQVQNSTVRNGEFTLNIVNPTKLLSINGVDFSTKENGIDYLIRENGNVMVKDLYNYIRNDFGVFEVTFQAGYIDEHAHQSYAVPQDLILTVANYVGYLFSKDNGRDIVSEQTGPRSVSYGTGSIENAEKDFRKAISCYIPLALRIY